jgi:hypothetical protein
MPQSECSDDKEENAGAGIRALLGGERMRSKAPHPHFTNVELLDEEFGAAFEQVAPKLKSETRRRRRRLLPSLCKTAR